MNFVEAPEGECLAAATIQYPFIANGYICNPFTSNHESNGTYTKGRRQYFGIV